MQAGELYGFLLVAQVGERYAFEGVDGHADEHHRHPVVVVGVLHEGGYLWQEREDECHEECRRGCHGDENGGIDRLRVFLALVHIAEECRLHAVGEHYEQQCRVGVDVGDISFLCQRKQSLFWTKTRNPFGIRNRILEHSLFSFEKRGCYFLFLLAKGG